MQKILNNLLPKLYGVYFNLVAIFSPKKAAHIAFDVFCTVRKGRVQNHQKEFLNSAKDQKLSFGGLCIQTYKWEGKKETVLLVHGWESNTWRWHKLISKLQDANYNIIAFDAPGHGNSSGKQLYVPLYSAALEEMINAYNPKYLIGHSVGGMTILFNEHSNSKPNVEKIITIGSPSEFYEILDNYQHLLRFNDKVLNAIKQYVIERFGFTVKDFSTTKFVKTNKKKGLLFHDRLDKITPYHDSVAVQKNWQGSRLITTEGLGHSMHQDEVNDEIIAFLEAKLTEV